MRHALTALLFTLLATSAGGAHAWWNKDWTQRARIVLDTSEKGAPVNEPAQALALAVRLHSGNFDFSAAKEDGADLRVVAGDDKTPLPFRIERFDGLNELAVLWVQLPLVAPNSDKNLLYVYAGNPKAAAEAGAGQGFDAATLAAIHFSDTQAADHAGTLTATAPFKPEANALLAGGARLDGSPITWAATDRLKLAAGSAVTWSLWVRPDVAEGTLLQQGVVQLALVGGKVRLRASTTSLDGGSVPPAAWTHVAATLGQGKVTLYVNGAQVAQAEGPVPELSGELKAGEGYKGVIDELQIAGTVRSPAWLRLAVASQGVDGQLVKSVRETGDSAEGGGEHGYMGILVKNLTVDAWVVIVILGLMFLLAVYVMINKTLFLGRTDRANRHFLQRFREAQHDLLAIEAHPTLLHSSLMRLYQAGVRELNKRDVGKADTPLSGASLDAVKAAVDADMVRETHRLNGLMVWLTIAISGGPFLGLLGTVVGVMITFAAIAAAGDVNVNAIAPGIAAALLATVAGLGVAIPALFGYNWLASRIKNVSADMQIFVDEFITRVAERYGSR